jgi:tagatose-1,6-bisphosphate aldolase
VQALEYLRSQSHKQVQSPFNSDDSVASTGDASLQRPVSLRSQQEVKHQRSRSLNCSASQVLVQRHQEFAFPIAVDAQLILRPSAVLLADEGAPPETCLLNTVYSDSSRV